MKRIFSYMAMVMLLIQLSGCEQDNSDLKAYIDDVNSRKGVKIVPIPELKPEQLLARKVIRHLFAPLKIEESPDS